MIIMLVRHAESIGNSEGRWVGREDVPLSTKGRCQAERLRARLESEGFNPTRIYTSPLIRTLETARIVAKNWNCPLVKWDDLVEIDVGSFSGMTTLEIEEHFPDLAKEFANTLNFDLVEGAEPHNERNARAQRVVERLAREHKNSDRVLLFSHGGTIHHIVASILGTSQVWSMNIRNTAIFEFTVDVDAWNQDPSTRKNMSMWRISRFGETPHLNDPDT